VSESVNLPALGESVTEGTVTRWLKNVGYRVEVDEPLLEVSTDKVDTEIPSPIAGVIEAILVAEDETVEVGTPLVTIGDGSGGGDAPAPAAGDEAAAPETSAPETPAPETPAPETPAPEAAAEAVAPSAPEAAAPAQPVAPSYPAPSAEASPFAPVPSQPAPAAPVAGAPAAAEVAAPSTEVPAPAQVAPAPVEETTRAPAEPAAPPAPVAAAPAPQAAAAPFPAPTAAAVPAPAESAAPAQPAAPAEATPAPDANPGYVTPLVRKLANEKGIDLSTVAGTGVGGRIRKEDVLSAAEASTAPEPAQAPVASAPAPLATSPLRGTSVPMSRLRKVIAERAVISMQTSAQLTSVVEVDVTLVANFRDRVKGEFLSKTGQKLSFLPFFALAAAEALRAYPIINSSIDGDTIVYPPQENISIAVDTERGLLTPVIRDAGSLDLAGLAGQIADLAARTRDNKLKPDELAGGTFTLTNTGSRGALFDTPIVFLPQSAILGTGIVTKKPVVVSVDGLDAIAIRSTVYLALSYDHRIVDGADAARFLVAVKQRLEGGDFAGNLGI
jgi:pyruvate dehydrogenase E2 component (dihydrolipoamide acetyltransferase)